MSGDVFSSAKKDAVENATLLLPSPPPPPHPADHQGGTRGQVRLLDRLLIGSVLALAFLLASLPARNSDVWLHLASGRLLAHGQYPFGVDPFAFTTHGVRWVNACWLYDLLCRSCCFKRAEEPHWSLPRPLAWPCWPAF